MFCLLFYMDQEVEHEKLLIIYRFEFALSIPSTAPMKLAEIHGNMP